MQGLRLEPPSGAPAVNRMKKKQAPADLKALLSRYERPMQTVWMRTGIHALDLIIGGGIPVGRIIEILGNESAGKSLLGWTILRAFQRAGAVGLVMDVEATAPTEFMKTLGIDLDNICYTKPERVEGVRDWLVAAVENLRKVTDLPIVAIWDSLAGDTLILTNRGEIPIKSLRDNDPDLLVYTKLEDGALSLRPIKAVAQTGWSKKVLKVHFSFIIKGKRREGSITCTPQHKFLTNRGWVMAKSLRPEDRLVPVYRHEVAEKHNEHRIRINCPLLPRWRYEHRLVEESVRGKLPKDAVVHHKNHSTIDNRPSNLDREMNQSSHIKRHCNEDPGWRDRAISLGKNWKGRKRTNLSARYAAQRAEKLALARDAILEGKNRKEAASCAGVYRTTLFRWLKQYPEAFCANHKIIGIEDGGVSDTFDICVEGSNNFVAAGVIVHNSIAATSAKGEWKKEDGKEVPKENEMASRASAMSDFFRQYTVWMEKNNVTLICINQLRDKIGVMFGRKTDSPGGHALKHHASVRIELTRGKRFEVGGYTGGVECHASIQKNKCAPPFRRATLRVNWNQGFDALAGLDEVLEESGRIKTAKPGVYKCGEEEFQKSGMSEFVASHPTLLENWL